MNPALPKPPYFRIEGRVRNFEEMQNSLARLNVRFGIAKKGRAG